MDNYVSYSDATELMTAIANKLNGKVDTSDVGSANGVAELDANGKVPSSQLPSYVDDVLEYADLAHFPATGETGKIYIAEDTNKTYRWSGSDYAEISESLALGETSSTAYAGNKGKANADAIAGIKNGTSINSFGAVETALAGKQDELTFDSVPTASSNNPVKSSGIYSTMAVPKYDAANRREYYEGGAAFSGNIDSAPTAGSNNAVASGGTKTYVDNAVSLKISKTSIQLSKAAFPPAEVGVQTVTVTFPTAFAHRPEVMVSWDDNKSLPAFFKYPLLITSITTTGFTVQAERLDAKDNWWFRYIAVDNQ